MAPISLILSKQNSYIRKLKLLAKLKLKFVMRKKILLEIN